MRSFRVGALAIAFAAASLVGWAPPEAAVPSLSTAPLVTDIRPEVEADEAEPVFRDSIMGTREVIEEIERLGRRKGEPSDDLERLLGAWVVESCKMNGKRVRSIEGQVEVYQRTGVVHIYGSDYETRQSFALDVTSGPTRLGTSYSKGFFSKPAICRFEEDRLHVREADTPQALSFDKEPQGDYWDSTLRKLSTAEAKRRIAEILERHAGLDSE